eukprot:TRINITY_DN3103_c0_g1_i1.p1 TRINITY_DN3103_c0_g1~~TRINITY_DN3103_c0_g1_i1.p1  ORF type:complete len:364 (-),score=82.73 TRINITY_DN3103_c0_g1_i1:142-1233(-)
MACQVASPWDCLPSITSAWGRKPQLMPPLHDHCPSLEQCPMDICAGLWSSMEELTSAGPNDLASASDRVQDCLQAMLSLLEQQGSTLAAHLLCQDVPARLVSQLNVLDFESRKSVVRTVNAIVKLLPHDTLLEYMEERSDYIKMLLDGSGNREVFIHCSSVLRASMRSDELVGKLLGRGAADRFTELAGSSDFDISSEAFASLRDLLLLHPKAAEPYLQANFDSFFGAYHSLLQDGESYPTRRRALKLLSEILMCRPLMAVMIKYVSNSEFLQLHMIIMRDRSVAMCVDVFHIFKIFAANPQKPRRVQQILAKNKDKIVKLLESRLGEKAQRNEALRRDLEQVIKILLGLGYGSTTAAAPAGA